MKTRIKSYKAKDKIILDGRYKLHKKAKEKIKELYEKENKTIKEIAYKYGVAYSTIYRIIHPRPERKHEYTKMTIAQKQKALKSARKCYAKKRALNMVNQEDKMFKFRGYPVNVKRLDDKLVFAVSKYSRDNQLPIDKGFFTITLNRNNKRARALLRAIEKGSYLFFYQYNGEYKPLELTKRSKR